MTLFFRVSSPICTLSFQLAPSIYIFVRKVIFQINCSILRLLKIKEMFLDKKVKNRYTIGKELRKLKQLRKRDPLAKVLPLTPELEAYKKDLEEKGMVVGPIDVALFETKNGLKYPGFMANKDIDSNSVLLRVPVGCLLTTRDAFLS